MFKKLIIIVCLYGAIFSKAQSKDNPPVDLMFYKDHNAVAIGCNAMCDWSILFIKKKHFYLNQNGMININVDQNILSNSSFLLIVKRSRNKIHITGLKGVKWKEISFKIPINENESISVNQYGYTRGR